MNRNFAVTVIAVSLTLACAGIVSAQETKYPDILDAKPMYKAGPNHMNLGSKEPTASLVQWNGSYTDLTGKTITYTQIGTNQTYTNTSKTIPVMIIPV